MIQRIQTVFLLLAAVSAGLPLWLPYLTGNSALPIFADGQFNAFDNPGLLGLCVLSGVLGLAAVFLYSNRPLQARIAGAGAVVSLFALLLLGFTLYQVYAQEKANWPLQLGASLFLSPLAVVLFWLALRAIRKDEALVKSMDRLR